MNADPQEPSVARIAGTIGEPARARMLYCLSDGRARTSTELAAVAEVSASTASAHLQRLVRERLVKVLVEGRHHYYSLRAPEVATALEALSVLAGGSGSGFVSATPHELRAARTCYDHMAGALGVSLHDRWQAMGWLVPGAAEERSYVLSAAGQKGFQGLGIDLAAAGKLRRRFAFPCLDWSERRPHLGGALGAALLDLLLRRRWVVRDPDGRALEVTRLGRRELWARVGLRI